MATAARTALARRGPPADRHDVVVDADLDRIDRDRHGACVYTRPREVDGPSLAAASGEGVARWRTARDLVPTEVR